MSNFIYSAMSGKNDPMFGKFEHPIKALIENESNICEKRKSILDILFNVEKSNRYAETIMGESDFSTFMSKQEGQGAENDNVEPTFKKTIEHIEFAKEFTITRKMADDAKFGIGADMKNKPRKFVRAYYNTRVKIAAQALINGTNKTMTFNKAKVDLTCADELALFHKAHPYFTDKMKGKTQSNYFYGEITGSAGALEEALGVLANKVRNFKDENGEMVVSKLDEEALARIAEITGGSYVRSTTQSIGLDEIVKAINEMEQTELSTVRFEEFNEQYQYLLIAALVLLLAEFLLLDRRNPLLRHLNIFREK